MTTQILIIGLGQIGASIGLALAEHNSRVTRIGYDGDADTSRKAEKLNAVDKTANNLLSAVQEADIVILALPQHEIRETIALIANTLKSGAIVMDTAAVKNTVSGWMVNLLPAERHYVALTPVISHRYLHETSVGIDAARADLFKEELIILTTPARTNPQAVDLAVNLIKLLGAEALFADAAEVDGLMAATHTLPQIASVALLNATTEQPGWKEGQKIAGRAFAAGTTSITLHDEVQSLADEALQNKDNVVRVINNLIAELVSLRDDIENQNEESLKEQLEVAHKNRLGWWASRQSTAWKNQGIPPMTDMPKSGQAFLRLIGLDRKADKEKKP